MIIREKIYDCGEFMRVHYFPVRRKASGKRGKRNNPTSETQERLNAKNAANKLTDLLHCNFTSDDISFGLDYDELHLPKTVEDAQKNVRNLIRRLKYSLRDKAKAKAVKYVFVTERSSTGRIHHHAVISGVVDRDTLESMWTFGRANTQRLQFDENGLCGKAHYITKGKATKKRWCASKNLTRPTERQNDYRIGPKTVKHIMQNPYDSEYIQKLYPGFSVAPGGVDVPLPEDTGNLGGDMFVSLFLYKDDNKHFYRDKWGRLYSLRSCEERGREHEKGLYS